MSKTVRIFTAVVFISILFLAGAHFSPIRANVSSAIFDGSNDYINVAHSAILNVGNTLTIEFWIKPRDLNGTDRKTVFSTRLNNPAGSWQIEVGSGGGSLNAPTRRNYAVVVASPSNWNALTYDNTVATDKWQHIAFTKASASGPQKIYINGVDMPLSADNTATYIDNADPKRIGGGAFSFTQYFPGLMDEMRLWNYARSQAEIQRDMRRELTGAELGLVAYWKFDENNNGCVTNDATANANNGQLVSAASTTCALSGASGDKTGFSTDIPGMTDDLPRLINTQITNSAKLLGTAQSEKGFYVKNIEASVNGSGFARAVPKDGQYNGDNEEFEFDFNASDNGNPYPDYVLEVQTIDSADRVGKRLFFDPFNLKTVASIDKHLELTMEINKQRNLLKNRLSHFKIEYSTDGTNYQKLLDEIPADFEQVRSQLRNLASHDQPNCDPCLFEDSTMYVSYSDNNSLLRVKTKEEFTKPNLTFRVLALNFDGNSQQSGTVSLEDKTNSKNSGNSLSSPREVTSAAKVQGEATKSIPGQKATFKETPSGGETGPIAAIINTFVDMIGRIVTTVATLIGQKQ